MRDALPRALTGVRRGLWLPRSSSAAAARRFWAPTSSRISPDALRVVAACATAPDFLREDRRAVVLLRSLSIPRRRFWAPDRRDMPPESPPIHPPAGSSPWLAELSDTAVARYIVSPAPRTCRPVSMRCSRQISRRLAGTTRNAASSSGTVPLGTMQLITGRRHGPQHRRIQILDLAQRATHRIRHQRQMRRRLQFERIVFERPAPDPDHPGRNPWHSWR